MNWTKEQEQAIYRKNSNILVAAGAGSGKTAVLVERIVNKIINEKIDIDKLLIVTFTNAAAAEMRERILNAIYKKIDEIEEEQEKENLYRQITLLNKASICTIDSFCLDVIKNNFFEIEISPNFRIGDTAEIELIKQEALEDLFEEKYELKDEDFANLIKTYTSYKDDTPLKDLILKIYSYISSNPYPFKWLEESIEKFNIENENIGFENTKWGEILLEEINNELIEDIGILQNEIKKMSVERELILYQKTLENDVFELEKLQKSLDNWDKAYTIANSIEFITWPRNKTEFVEEKENAKNTRDSVKKKIKEKIENIFVSDSKSAILDIKEMYKTLNYLQKLIVAFHQKFIQIKKERNILDFSDVEHYALEILVNETDDGKHKRSEIAKKYQKKFEEIAIDEYQDSNLVQEYILTSVSRGNNIFMVGDVKQSIYKFRQAMPELFLSKYKQYSEENPNEKGLKIQLFKNFRSGKNVLDLTNLIFENIMSEKLGDIEYLEDEFLILGRPDIENKILNEINIIDVEETEEVEEDDDENKEQEEKIENVEIEAKFVAKKIKDLIESKYQIYDFKKEKYRELEYKDIVILLRSTKGKAPVFEKELINQEIPVYSDTSSEYIDSIEIQTILSLLKIIDNPMQDIPLVMVLRSIIGKFTDNELVEIRLVDQYSDFYTAMLKAKISVENELRTKIEQFIDNLENWREEKEYLSLDEFIWKIYEDTGFLNYVGTLPNGSLRQANLKILFERAKQYETASFKGLFNFIRFIERLRLGSGDLNSAKIIGENENVVRIMSIHKSKGLEFPIVFLSSTGTKFNLRDINQDILLDQEIGLGVKYINYDMQIKYDTLTKLALKDKILKSILSEEMRILYVALTRAKEKLIITGLTKGHKKEKQKKEELMKIYNKNEKKINPILIQKYKTYLDWIELVYFKETQKIGENTSLKLYKKSDIIKDLKEENKEEFNVIEEIEKESENITEDEIKQIEEELDFEYKYKQSIEIPSKISITQIIQKDKEDLPENLYKTKLETEESKEIKFPTPKFLINQEEEKVSPAQRGTVIHLCMKNLDFSKQYELKDIKELIELLIEKKLITEKEAKTINPYQILNFTKTNIWEELKEAKEYYKEEPFYINIPAKEILEDSNSSELVLAQGIIDLFYINKNDELVLLDYKTDYVQEGEENVLINRHKPQLMIYKKALENALNRNVDKIYIYSTALGKEVLV